MSGKGKTKKPEKTDLKNKEQTTCRKQSAGKRNSAAKGTQRILGGSKRFFRRAPSEVGKRERMKFIAQNTEDGAVKRKIAFYYRAL